MALGRIYGCREVPGHAWHRAVRRTASHTQTHTKPCIATHSHMQPHTATHSHTHTHTPHSHKANTQVSPFAYRYRDTRGLGTIERRAATRLLRRGRGTRRTCVAGRAHATAAGIDVADTTPHTTRARIGLWAGRSLGTPVPWAALALTIRRGLPCHGAVPTRPAQAIALPHRQPRLRTPCTRRAREAGAIPRAREAYLALLLAGAQRHRGGGGRGVEPNVHRHRRRRLWRAEKRQRAAGECGCRAAATGAGVPRGAWACARLVGVATTAVPATRTRVGSRRRRSDATVVAGGTGAVASGAHGRTCTIPAGHAQPVASGGAPCGAAVRPRRAFPPVSVADAVVAGLAQCDTAALGGWCLKGRGVVPRDHLGWGGGTRRAVEADAATLPLPTCRRPSRAIEPRL